MIEVRRHGIMLLRWIKAEVILKVIYHTLNIILGAPLKDLIVSIRFFDMLKISAKELFWS